MNSRLRSLVDWLRFDILPSPGFLLTLLAICVVAYAAGYKLSGDATGARMKPVNAVIAGFGASPDQYNPGIFVSARGPNGIVGGLIVKPSEIRGCKVGDKINATQDGVALYLYPAPCQK